MSPASLSVRVCYRTSWAFSCVGSIVNMAVRSILGRSTSAGISGNSITVHSSLKQVLPITRSVQPNHRAKHATKAPTAGRNDRVKFRRPHFLTNSREPSSTPVLVPRAACSRLKSSSFVDAMNNMVKGTMAMVLTAATAEYFARSVDELRLR